jgi:hypothetical protein
MLCRERIVGREAIEAHVAGHKLAEDDVLPSAPLRTDSSSTRTSRSSSLPRSPAARRTVDLPIDDERQAARDWPIQERELSKRVAEAVREHFPFGPCFVCLARHLGVMEPNVRNAAQALVVDRFRKMHKICYGCSRVDDTLVPLQDD